jgi:gas vesicle protein
MANRVNVNINVRDNSRSALAGLRRDMNRTQNQARRMGANVRFNVRIDDRATRREINRIQRQLRGRNVTFNTRFGPISPPPRTMRQQIVRRLGGAISLPVRLSSRGMVAGVRGPLRSLGGLVSGTLNDGIGQGILNGFKAGGPAGVIFLGGLLVSMFALIGAALSGLIITALGAAFVGVGAVSAAMSDKIKAKWSETLDVLKEEFRDVGEPLIPVLDRALSKLQEMAKAAGPQLRKALEETAPATEKFIQGIMKGFESFGKAAFKPIMDAWNVFAPVFGEEWDEFMDELGNSFKEMANLVKEHPTEIAMALDIVFETLDLLVDAVTFFGRVWVAILDTALMWTGVLGQGIATMGNMALDALGAIVNGAAKAFGWMPGIGPKLKDAASSFNQFRDQARERLNSIANAANNMRGALDRANKKRRLEADISSWQAKLSTARADLKKTSNQKARAKLQADISDLNNKISRARSQLASLNGRTATTYVRTVQLGIGAEAANAARRATGGNIGAAATGGARSNLTLVGEQGPELVRLPFGSQVRSNSNTRQEMRRTGGTGGRMGSLFIDAAGDDLSQLLLKVLRHAIRDQGGDVQVVLGRG